MSTNFIKIILPNTIIYPNPFYKTTGILTNIHSFNFPLLILSSRFLNLPEFIRTNALNTIFITIQTSVTPTNNKLNPRFLFEFKYNLLIFIPTPINNIGPIHLQIQLINIHFPVTISSPALHLALYGYITTVFISCCNTSDIIPCMSRDISLTINIQPNALACFLSIPLQHIPQFNLTGMSTPCASVHNQWECFTIKVIICININIIIIIISDEYIQTLSLLVPSPAMQFWIQGYYTCMFIV